MTTLSIGHYLRFYNDAGGLAHAFQNFYLSENVTHQGVDYSFVPFGFSGMSTSRQGDLSPATLVFPNTALSRGYLDEALRGGVDTASNYGRLPYVGEVDVNILNPDTRAVTTTLLTYTGSSTAGGWNDTQLTVELSSVLDAVTGDVPTRTLHRALVGGLPTTGNIQLR